MKTTPILRALALVLTLTLAADLRAGTVTVTNNTDSHSFGFADSGTLRWAIATAAPGDTIVFVALNPSVITLTNGQLTVNKNLTIDASALVGGVTVSLPEFQEPQFPEPEFTPSRIFQITNNATVELNSLTLRNGAGVTEGGGIYNSSGCNLTLTHCTLSGNSAYGGTGSTGVYSPGGNGGNASGGGIYNAGTLVLNLSTLSGNSAIGGQGGTGLYSLGGTGGSASGGGIYNAGTLVLNRSTLSGNSAAGGSGGAGSNAGSTGGLGGSGSSGGGIHNTVAGTTTVNQSTLSGNNARGGTGGAGSNGIIAGNAGNAGNGGGIQNGGTLTLNQSTLAGNLAAGGAGGYGSNTLPGNGGNGGSGAGIYNSGVLTLNQVTLTGGSTPVGPGGGSTGSGNGTAGTGGGSVGGILNLSNCSLRNCLIALNTSALHPDMSGVFVSQGYNLLGVLDGSTGLVNGSNNDLVGTGAAPLDPLIGPLADNDGDTFTVALLEGSPARDAGDNTTTDPFDQRGLSFPRLFGGSVDIGAYEAQGIPIAPAILSQSAGSVVIDPATRVGSLSVSASVNPNNALTTTVWLQYGVWDGYGYETPSVSLGYGVTGLPVSLPLSILAPGNIWHYRVVASSAAGTTYGEDQTVSASSPGDFDGDGTVSQTELDAVIAASGATLFNQTQFDANRSAGRNDVTSDPNAYSLYNLSQVQALNVGTPLIQKDGLGQFKLTIGVQKSTTLLPGSFQPFALDSAGASTSINGAGNLEFLFTVPDNAAFFRVESE